MSNKKALASLFIKSFWMVLTIWVLVFSGPLRKMIEFHFDQQMDLSAQGLEKKLKTYYREKRDTPSFTQFTQHSTPDIDPGLFTLAGIMSLFFLTRKNNVFQVQHVSTAAAREIPLYLQIRRLQV